MRLAVFAAVGFVSIAGVWFVRDRASANRERASLQRELAALRHELEDVEADARRAQSATRRLAAAAGRRDWRYERTQAAAQPAPSEAQSAKDEEAAGEQARGEAPEPELGAAEAEEAQVDFHRTRNEARFVSEPRDPEWAEPARTQVEGLLRAQAGSSSQVGSVECRQSLCRAEVAHTDERERQRYVRDVINALETGLDQGQRWPGERMALRERQPDGTLVTVLYYAREGQPFLQDTDAE